MNSELISAIDNLIEEYTDKIAKDTINLVNIKSVQEEAEAGAPFGRGPKMVLDTILDMGNEAGLFCTDYNVGVISLALKDATPDLGIWIHGDVVTEGEGWNFEPYNATEYKGCIIGRGATDNKGQFSAIFNLFKIFKDLNISLDYNPAIYVGSNEESGMKDLTGIPGNPDAKGFLNVATPPKLSLVPDSSFPLGYGGKGGMTLVLRSKSPLRGFSLIAGQDDAPGNAVAIFDRTDIPDSLPECTVSKDTKTTVTTFSPPKHGAHPDPNGNMITQISSALLDADLVHKDDTKTIEFLRIVSSDIYGKALGIETNHEIMGPLTVFSKRVDSVDGYCDFHINIRYPLGITYEKIVENVEKAAKDFGFVIAKEIRGTSPYILDPNNSIAKELTAVANSVTGDDKQPTTISGGTYAHFLPNAYVYGMNGNLPPDDFPKGRGGAHGVDECVSLERLKRAMRIYARALLRLNEITWD